MSSVELSDAYGEFLPFFCAVHEFVQRKKTGHQLTDVPSMLRAARDLEPLGFLDELKSLAKRLTGQEREAVAGWVYGRELATQDRVVRR